jgi:hypothetical protein
MKIQCINRELSAGQKAFHRMLSRFNPQHAVTVGKEYLVIAISFVVGSPFYGDSALYEVVNDNDHLVSVPASLFKIIDARCSTFWMARDHGDGTLSLRPEELYQDYFYDKLSDRDPATRQEFKRLVAKLQGEFDASNDDSTGLGGKSVG